MTTIGSLGIGLFILIIVWILALIVFVVGVKFQSNIAWIALGIASALTLIILVIPTESRLKPAEIPEIEDKDYIIVYKNILLAILILSALIGFSVFFIAHCIEPIRLKPIKDFYDHQ